MTSGFDRVISAAGTLDRWTFSPSQLAERAIRRHTRRRRARAGADPTWAAIEARRATKYGTKTMLSDDLTLADWHTQDRIAERITPDPWWLPAARRLTTVRLVTPLGRAAWAAERTRRGWSDRDLWSLDRVLCERLGAQLVALADATHSWPQSDEFPESQDWDRALRTQAAALTRYGTGGGQLLSAALDEWYVLATRAGVPAEQTEAARQRLDDLEASNSADAKDALRWVADHLESLWD